jgi:hypothetical protein
VDEGHAQFDFLTYARCRLQEAAKTKALYLGGEEPGSVSAYL